MRSLGIAPASQASSRFSGKDAERVALVRAGDGVAASRLMRYDHRGAANAPVCHRYGDAAPQQALAQRTAHLSENVPCLAEIALPFLVPRNDRAGKHHLLDQIAIYPLHRGDQRCGFCRC